MVGIASSLVSQATKIALDGRGKINWVSVASDGVTSGVQSALATIAQQRQQIGNTTTASPAAAAIDSAPALAQANRDYATRNADQGSMMASASLKASNDATAARQLAEQMNASGGQVTPLLFGNDASAGGAAGGSLAERTARTGALVADYVGKAGDVGVVYGKDQYMKGIPNNAVKFNGADEAIKYAQAKFGTIGADGLRIGPTIERAKLLSTSNKVLRDKNGFIIKPLSDFTESKPQATIERVKPNLTDYDVTGLFNYAGNLASVFNRVDGLRVNPISGNILSNKEVFDTNFNGFVDAASLGITSGVRAGSLAVNTLTKGAAPTLPSGMTNPEFGLLAKWGKKSEGAWSKVEVGYSDSEIQAIKDAGVTQANIESWKIRYENMAKITISNPQDTPVPRAKLMQLILEKW